MESQTIKICRSFVEVDAVEFRSKPLIADLKPGGRFVAKDLYKAGGGPAAMRVLLDAGYIDGDCLTVTGKSMRENLEGVELDGDQKVIRTADEPLSPTDGVVGLQGNLAPDGTIV